MKKINYLISLLALFFFVVSLDSSRVVASVSPVLSVSPAKMNLPIKPGEKQEAVIRVTNRSEVTVPLKAVPMDFAPKDIEGGIDFGKSLPNRSAVSWLQITPAQIVLAPNESKEVTVTITPPATLDPGGYYAVTMFQAELPDSYFDSLDQTQAKVIPWIGTLLLLQNGDFEPLDDNALTIKRFIIPRFSLTSTVPAVVEVANNTAYHLAPEAEFLVESRWGPVKARIKTKEITILPGSSRILDAEIVDAPSLGLYQGKAVVRIASYQKSVVTWPLILLTAKGAVIVSSFLIALILFILLRRRFVATIKVLVSKNKPLVPQKLEPDNPTKVELKKKDKKVK